MKEDLIIEENTGMAACYECVSKNGKHLDDADNCYEGSVGCTGCPINIIRSSSSFTSSVFL